MTYCSSKHLSQHRIRIGIISSRTVGVKPSRIYRKRDDGQIAASVPCVCDGNWPLVRMFCPARAAKSVFHRKDREPSLGPREGVRERETGDWILWVPFPPFYLGGLSLKIWDSRDLHRENTPIGDKPGLNGSFTSCRPRWERVSMKNRWQLPIFFSV